MILEPSLDRVLVRADRARAVFDAGPVKRLDLLGRCGVGRHAGLRLGRQRVGRQVDFPGPDPYVIPGGREAGKLDPLPGGHWDAGSERVVERAGGELEHGVAAADRYGNVAVRLRDKSGYLQGRIRVGGFSAGDGLGIGR